PKQNIEAKASSLTLTER
ncbi:polysulfide reductase, NrfD family protein, partial [Vibrio parahaemolyticus 10296]